MTARSNLGALIGGGGFGIALGRVQARAHGGAADGELAEVRQGVLDALDAQRLPGDLLDPKLSATYRILALSKRGGRLIVVTADPSDHEAAEKVKFATQMGVE